MSGKKEIVSVLSDLDGSLVAMNDVENLLQFFDERLYEEVEHINPDEQWTAACFKGRFKLLYSTLTVIGIRLHDVLNEMRDSVKQGYEIIRQNREGSA